MDRVAVEAAELQAELGAAAELDKTHAELQHAPEVLVDEHRLRERAQRQREREREHARHVALVGRLPQILEQQREQHHIVELCTRARARHPQQSTSYTSA